MTKFLFFALLILLTGCEYFKPQQPPSAVARVGEEYLTLETLTRQIPNGTPAEDSLLLAQTFINQWATEKLLILQSKINLSFEKQEELERLIERYRSDLYTRAYKEAIVSRQLDTVISDTELQAFYSDNAPNFRLNDEIYQMIFIQLPSNYSNPAEIEKMFKRFNADDRKHLDSISLQFLKFNLRDSIWVRESDILRTLPVINAENKNQVLKISQFSKLQDSLSVYLVAVKNHLQRNQTAPLPYVEETLREIILNKRTSELIKKLETELTNEAIKDKTFQIFPLDTLR